MKIKRLIFLTFTTLIIATFLNTFTSVHVKASPEAHLYIEPALVTQTPGQNFTVTVKIEECPRIYAWYVNISWNPTIIKLLKVDEGPFLNQYGTRKTDFIKRINNVKGSTTFGCSLKGEPSAAQPQGSGILATLTFNVLNRGATPLHFEWVELYDYIDIKERNPPKPYTATDGEFSYPIYKISIQPEYVYLPLLPGEKFNVSVAAFVENLYSWNATISWDSTIINVTRVFEGPFLNMDGAQPTQFNYQIFGNKVTINGTILDGQPVNSTMENPEILAIIEFEVKAIGESDIIFEDFYFFGMNGEPIPVYSVRVNGKFSNLWRDIKVEVNLPVTSVKRGQTVTITVIVKNMGVYPETFEVRVYAGPLGLTLIGSRTLSLGPHEEVTLTFNWDTSACEGDSYLIRALVDPLLQEGDVENNLAAKPITVESPPRLPIELIVAAVIVAAIIVLVATLALKRRRKRKL